MLPCSSIRLKNAGKESAMMVGVLVARLKLEMVCERSNLPDEAEFQVVELELPSGPGRTSAGTYLPLISKGGER